MGNYFAPKSEQVGSIGPTDRLIGPDNLALVPKTITLKAGNNLTRGAVLEESSTAGKYQHVATANKAIYILAEDVDATSADKLATVYAQGSFNKSALTVGGALAVADVISTLEARSIFIRDSVAGA